MSFLPTGTTFSFEYFPPRTQEAQLAFWKVAGQLARLGPGFQTVTFGAGGSDRARTLDLAIELQARTGIPTAAHLTYINLPRKDLFALTDRLWKAGIRRLVALRGDLPKDLRWPLDPDGDYFQNTSHFVAALRARHDFDVSVGAYPEKHPDAPSLDADMQALKHKSDAGAARAITQFFFDIDTYDRFLDRCRAWNINRMPVIPGLLPVYDAAQVRRFAGRCGVSLPADLDDIDGETRLREQIDALLQRGTRHIHFYTLNKAGILLKTLKPLLANTQPKRRIAL
jgi:methylenetetrahydrofolate reductase (NADPH)